MTEYGPWLLQCYWSYVKKNYETNALNFCGYRIDSDFVVGVTDDIQAVQEGLLCVKLVTSRYVTLRISIPTHLIRKNIPWFKLLC